ncbi:MAG: hypothetical protein QOI95_934 [Acidimicrobiaceae bacterium]
MPMGYRGKTTEQNQARDLRAQGWTYKEICDQLRVAKSSVSLWCRDVPVDAEVWARKVRESRRFGARTRANSLALRRQHEIDQLRVLGRERIGRLSTEAFFVAGVALYAGEGSKTDGAVKFANSDPRMILFFITWLRCFFDVDESRLRLWLYLHEGLDLDAAISFWSELTEIPTAQFGKPYRATPDPSIRRSKHPMGCPSVAYACSRTHRAVMGLVDALLTCSESLPG